MDEQPTFADALTRALADVDQAAADGATVRLAYAYAAELDTPGADLVKVGPLLLACLTELGMTPKARAAVTGKGGPTREPTGNPLDEIRQRRERRDREHNAATLDPTAT